MIPELYPEETVILEVRRHWFIFFLQAIFLVILVCLPFLVLVVFGQNEQIKSIAHINEYFNLGAAVWFLCIWVAFFIMWTEFYLDAWVITDKRILDIQQRSLFNRQVSEFRIDNIQDITIDINGFIPTILGYGNILIETAGEKESCTMKNAPHPERIKDIVSHLQSRESSNDV